MAVEIATAYVNLVPSARGISRSIGRELGTPLRRAAHQAGDDAGRTINNSVQKRLGSASRQIAKTASLAFAGVGVGLGVLTAFGLKAAASFQQTRIAFEGILGSAETADKFLQGLRKFAAKTPFEFPELADSAKNLLAVGFAADDVIPTMTKLGNVAATLGVGGPEIQGVVRALGQMKGKGKASAEELNQISEQMPGFSAIKAIAEDMGVSVGEAFATMATGAIPADQAISAILKGMEKFPGAAGAMARQSLTLNGVLSTFKDTMRDTLVNAIEPILPTMSSALNGLTPLLQSSLTGLVGALAPLVPTLLTAVTQAVGAIAPIVGSLTKTLGPILGEVGNILAATFTALQPTFVELQPIIAELGDAFLELLRAVAPLIPPLAQLALVLLRNIGVPAIVAITTAIAALATALLPLLENTTLLTPVVTALGGAFLALKAVKGVRAGLLGVAKASGTAYRTLQRLLASTIAQRVASIAAAAASKIMAAAQWLLNAAMSANPIFLVVAAIAALVAGVILAYKNFKPFRDVVDAVGRALAAAAGVIMGAVLTAFNWIKDHWPLLLAIITGPIGLAVLAIVRNWDTILAATKAVWEAIVGAISFAVGLVTGIVTGAWDGIKAATNAVWGTIARVVTTHINIIRSVIEGVVKIVQAVWSGLWNGMQAVAETVIRSIKGVINGLLGVIQAVYDGFRSLWNAIEVKVPSFDPPGPGPTFGGFTLGLPKMPEMKIPRLAGGGVLTEPTLALLAETSRSQPEIATPAKLMREIVGDELDRRAGRRQLAEQIVFNHIKDPADAVRQLTWAQRTGGH